jgi:hypothetical protein
MILLARLRGTLCLTAPTESGLLAVRRYLSIVDQTQTIEGIGAADPATHKIYIWDISNDGQFATALDGGREPLIDIHVRLFSHVAGYLSITFSSGIRMPLGLLQQLTKVLCSFGIVPLQSGGVHLLVVLKKQMRM